MSYKVNEIHQIEHNFNKYGLSKDKYLSGFEFKGEKYSLGWITLSENGMKKLGTNNPKAEIVSHWISDRLGEGYCFRYYNTTHYGYYKWDYINKYDINLDDYIEDTGIDYKNTTVDETLNMPKDQMFDHLQTKQIIEGTYTPPEKAKPLFKDWQVPELIVGWIAFIIFLLVVFVFKDWYIQLILRVVGCVVFSVWRKQKLFGMK